MGSITRSFANNILTSGKFNAAQLDGTLPALDGSSLTGIPADYVHIKTVTAGGVSSIDFIHGTDSVVLDSTYNIYKVIGYQVDFGSSTGLVCRWRVNGSFITSGYETNSASLSGTNTSFALSGGSTNSSFIRMGWQRYTGTTTGFSQNFEATFYNLPSTAKDKHMMTHMVNNGNSTNDATYQISSGTLDSEDGRNYAVDGIRFGSVSFNITMSGKFALYGLKDS